jgi:hypothetical protein
MLFFLEIIHLLVEETNRYYWIYFDTLDKGWSPLPDVAIQEMYSFLAIIVQMGHDQKDMIKLTGTQQNNLVCSFMER